MRLQSTRGKSGEVNFKQALFQGLAPDGGLYYPVESKSLKQLFTSLDSTHDFNHIAKAMSHAWLRDEWDETTIDAIVNRAFHFSPRCTSLTESMHVLELFHGPSSAFKDFGACFLASCMEEILLEEERKAIILVATSGDTGSAVAQAFFDKKNIDVVILYPSGRVSSLQEKQLTTLGKNIHALEVAGAFDDCQRMVKEAFCDKALNSRLTLTSANSISIGRLFPQSFYYVYAYAQLKERLQDNFVFCVPSGNFGNLTAGMYAWTWGLPVSRFIAATNINDVVPEYLKTKLFSPRASVHTLSNAMDVGNPSNFERMMMIFNGDGGKMAEMVHGEVVTDTQTRDEMGRLFHASNIFVDPHTAVGITACQRYMDKPENKNTAGVILSTAHPAKFIEIVEQATGNTPGIPDNLKKALALTKQATKVNNTLSDLREFLMDNFRH
ncbi:MAG: threonine synthase [Spirochaetales bacterium]|nr:threonine synthase [Spirochaetales bacterium]